MFKKHFQYRHPEDDAGGGADDKGGDDAAAAAAAAKGGDGKAEDKGAAADGLLGAHKAGKGKEGDKGGETKAGEDGRPADVPEQFWNKETKAVNHGALIKAYTDTRQALKTAQGGKGKMVASADEYDYKPPEGVPEHINTAPDDPTVKALRALCFKAGMTQEKFTEFVGGYFQHAAELIKAPDLAAEKAKLGENADKVMDAVLNWGNGLVEDGIWSQAEYDEIIGMGSTAEGLKALNKLRQFYGGESIPVNAGEAGEGGMSLDECYTAAGTEKYYTDPAYRAKIDKQIERIVGTEPAGSSRAGMGVTAPVARTT